MSTGAVAAIDLGATSGRVIIGHVGPDTLDATSVARFANDPVQIGDGLHWDVLSLYGAALKGSARRSAREPGIASIGIDSWAVDYGLLRNGRLLGDPFHYRDERTARGVETVHDRMPHAELYERNGLQFLPFNTLYQFAAEPRDSSSSPTRALLIPDLVGYWLTGEARAERPTPRPPACSSATREHWDDELIKALGIPRGILPPLIAPGERLGALLPDVAASIGAAPGHAGHRGRLARHRLGGRRRADAARCRRLHLVRHLGPRRRRGRPPVLTPEALAANFTNEGGVDGRVRFLHNVMGLWLLSEPCARGSARGTRSTCRRCWTRRRRSRHPSRSST